jgi:Tfp pilus assembly protein PilO
VRARVESLSPRVLIAVAGVAVVLYAAVAWFLVVSPKRADASDARVELAAAQSRLADAELALLQIGRGGAPVTDVFRLAKAMPSSDEQSGLVLELERLAEGSGLVLESITVEPPVAAVGGPALRPVTVGVRGRYAQITNFLMRVRTLVTVTDGAIHATGRLLSARSVALTESDTGDFPELDASIGFDAYVYDGPIAPAEAPEEESAEEEDVSSGPTAAGSTP